MYWTRWLEPFRFRPFEGSRSLRARAMHRLRGMVQRPFCFVEGYWVSAPLDREIDVPPARINVELRRAMPADLPLFGRRKVEEVKAHFDAGDVAIIALHGEELVYVKWLLQRPSYDNAMLAALPHAPGQGYISDGFAVPRFRRQGLHFTVTAYCVRWLKEHGCREATAFILHDNVSSRRVYAKLGFTIHERWVRVRLGGRSWLLRSPCGDPLVQG